MCKKDAESNIAPIDLYYYSYFPTSLPPPPDLHADAARKQIILSFRFHNHSPMLLLLLLSLSPAIPISECVSLQQLLFTLHQAAGAGGAVLVPSVLLSGEGNYQREARDRCSDVALSHKLSPRAATRFRSKVGPRLGHQHRAGFSRNAPQTLGSQGHRLGKTSKTIVSNL